MTLLSDVIDAKPSIYEEVDKKKQKETMIKEYQFKNDVWDAVSIPEGKYEVSSIWIYKIQHAVDGNIVGYKARFVERGFSQKEGIDYEETFVANGS